MDVSTPSFSPVLFHKYTIDKSYRIKTFRNGKEESIGDPERIDQMLSGDFFLWIHQFYARSKTFRLFT